MSDAVLKVENLKVHFPVKGGLFTKKTGSKGRGRRQL